MSTEPKRMGRPATYGPTINILWPKNLQKHNGEFFDHARFNYLKQWKEYLPIGTPFPDLDSDTLEQNLRKIPDYIRKRNRNPIAVGVGIAGDSAWEEIVGFPLAFYQMLIKYKILSAPKFTDYLKTIFNIQYKHSNEVRLRMSIKAKERWEVNSYKGIKVSANKTK